MSKKQINVLFILLIIAFAAISAMAKELRTGQWSNSVNGIQGRLSVTEGTESRGTQQIIVFLELRNVGNFLNPLELYFDTSKSINSRILNKDGKLLKQPTINFGNILRPSSFWIVLPFDSTLRFRISISGYGVAENSGKQIQMMSSDSISGNWLIKTTEREDYFLEASYNSEPPKIEVGRRIWSGTIKLPKVLIYQKTRTNK
jgi:hypothetical protein